MGRSRAEFAFCALLWPRAYDIRLSPSRVSHCSAALLPASVMLEMHCWVTLMSCKPQNTLRHMEAAAMSLEDKFFFCSTEG